MIDEDKVKWPPKKKYPCKRLKGEHDFELSEVWSPFKSYVLGQVEPVYGNPIYHYRCSACNKFKVTNEPLGVAKQTKDFKII